MKKVVFSCFSFLLLACSSVKPPESSYTSYDVLFSREQDGGRFQFYEIITEESEYKMLLNDPIISPYLKKEDIQTCNFILVNLGEKPTGGWTIKVERVKVLKDKVEVVIKEIPPKGMATTAMTTPNFVIKIKSKKPIEIINPGS
ncbi:protease complex subunit PrcB family protein [Flavobacterium stagni]|uniref:Protease complex subunit PrcB family protein n=1 Tax=Flavobacterium stagni TaxID=2506421 RepID=A0A4Q1KB05_9FLAO|nr:protease complex subunit PrcB family protein [Flavobacterium stagni]RXR22914.1 protease complex subunit PrcB family protein [Flavobacterium stagni]